MRQPQNAVSNSVIPPLFYKSKIWPYFFTNFAACTHKKTLTKNKHAFQFLDILVFILKVLPIYLKILSIPCNRDLIVIVKARDTLFCVGKENFRSSWINFFFILLTKIYIEIFILTVYHYPLNVAVDIRG